MGKVFIATAIARTLRRQPIEIFGSLSLSRDYVFIDDVARAVLLGCADTRPQATWNVGSGVGRSLQEIVEMIFQAVGHETELRHGSSRPMDIPRMALDVSRIDADLDWRPAVAMEDGLQRTVEWMREFIA